MDLKGKRIAFLMANEGVEQVELTEPWKAVEEAGGQPVLVAPEAGQVQAFNHLDKADTFPVDETPAETDPQKFDGLMLPGGVANPDHLRMIPEAIDFVQSFFAAGKVVAAICHAPWMLVEAGQVKGRTLTSWRASRPTSATPAVPGWTRRSTPRTASSPAASRTTCPPSARR